MIKCAIFDADGTLLDSMAMWRDITYEYPQSKGVAAPEGLHHTLNRLSMEQCADYYREMGIPGTREQILEELTAFALRGYESRVPEKPSAREFLQLLHENGISIAVATASHAEGVAGALKRLGMLPFVDFLLSCTQAGKSKEHPDVFLRCAEQLGASPKESVVFEDSPYAMETAKRAGFAVVAVEDGISLAHGRAGRDLDQIANRQIRSYAQLIQELTPPEEDFAAALGRGLGG